MQRSTGRQISQIVINKKGDCTHVPGLYGRDHWVHLNVHDAGTKFGLQPPLGVPPHVWINIVSSLIAVRGGLIASAIVLARLMYFLVHVLNTATSGPMLFPDFRLLLDVVLAAPLALWSPKSDYSGTLVNLLSGVVTQCRAFECFVGFDVERDVISKGKSCVIDIPTVYPPWLRLFIVELIIAQILYGRIHRHQKSDDTEVVIYLDEADQDLTMAASDGAYTDGFSMLAQLLRMGREFGISCVIGLGVLGHISRYVSSSFQYTFIFNVSTDGDQKTHAARILSLERGAEDMLSALEPGHCVFVESMGAWPHPMLCKVDYLPPHRGAVEVAYDQCWHVPSMRLHELPHVQKALADLIGAQKQTQTLQARASRQQLSDNAHKLLRLASVHPFVPVARLFEQIGHLSQAAQASARKDLEDHKLAQFEEIRIGSRNCLLIGVSDEGLQFLGGGHGPKKPGRGGIAHRHVAAWLLMVGQKRGFRTQGEWVVPGTSHPVDAVWMADGQTNVFEAVLECRSNVSQHVEACLLKSGSVTTVTVVAPQKAFLADLKNTVCGDPKFAHVLDRIRFMTVEPLLEELWP